jgi:hypothetical protein
LLTSSQAELRVVPFKSWSSEVTDESWRDPAKIAADGEVAFDYLKGPDFRVVWADGVVGAVTANRHIQFTLFAERPAIPRRQVYKLDEATGQLGTEVVEKRISRSSIVRELACDVHLTPDTAAKLAEWLMERVKEAKEGT